jgi:hypothetical protein
MSNHHKRDEWLQDIEARQRNVVFPDTVQNETRFWRNLGNQGWSASTKVGLFILGVIVLGRLTVFLIVIFQKGVNWPLALVVLAFWGAIFAAIAWSTRRSLRDIQNARRHRRR